jgi:hypothetical protein
LIEDAVNAASNNMGYDELFNITNDSELSKNIYELSKDVTRYSYFKLSVDLGVRYGPDDLSFTDMILFSWIANRKKNG